MGLIFLYVKGRPSPNFFFAYVLKRPALRVIGVSIRTPLIAPSFHHSPLHCAIPPLVCLYPIKPVMATTPCDRKLILDNVLDGVGRTPLVRLDRIAKAHGLKCNLRTSPPSYCAIRQKIARCLSHGRANFVMAL